ncbi:MAG: sulfatase-like hydrolase/transferase, partial [Phycisphaeraceae bacterium]|nr:sulfatase-like hydrolase/transferase [Phycisphaeraceae bacterium]
YDAIAQTRDLIDWINDYDDAAPFFSVLSWGPPHAPYRTAPERYQQMYNPAEIKLRDNVPESVADQARKDIAGYYAHITALDDCVGELLACLEEKGIADNTILVLTSDHGDMLGSRGEYKKQRPWAESVRVPFILRWPDRFGRDGRRVQSVIDTPDIMPTLLSLCDLPIPDSVQGRDRSPVLDGPDDDATGLFNCLVPFGQWTRDQGGRESRGILDRRFTYVEDRDGPWLLYDNPADPCQLNNLVDDPDYQPIRDKLAKQLAARLKEIDDPFREAEYYIEKWGYPVNDKLTVAYSH